MRSETTLMTCRVPRGVAAQVDALAREWGLSRSRAIEVLVAYGLRVGRNDLLRVVPRLDDDITLGAVADDHHVCASRIKARSVGSQREATSRCSEAAKQKELDRVRREAAAADLHAARVARGFLQRAAASDQRGGLRLMTADHERIQPLALLWQKHPQLAARFTGTLLDAAESRGRH